jgi:outer membrane receptor for ferrienterochelin and colicin
MDKFFIWILFTSLSLYSFASTNPDYSEDDIFDLSLEELSKITIKTGSLMGSSTIKSPSAITIINRQSIELSGAKNIAHLLEQYVPGMMLMTHSEGEKIGLRGQIAAENYKLLLLVNGKNVTNMVYEGVITEIDQ